MDKTNEKEPLPLKIDPKWYVGRVTSPEIVSKRKTQHTRCSQNVYAAHKERRRPSRFLYRVQEGGNRV